MQKLTPPVEYVLYALLYKTGNKIRHIGMSTVSVTLKYCEEF